MAARSFDDFPKLDYKATLHYPLLNLSRGLYRRCSAGGDERNRLAALHPALPTILLSMMDVLRETWDSARHLCADGDGSEVRVEFAVAVPPLARVIADSLFGVLYLFEDAATRCAVFLKANAAKMHLDDIRYRARYGEDPKWAEWLRLHSEQVKWWKDLAGFTAEDEANAKKVARLWPNPGAMKSQVGAPGLREFLQYMDDWFYAHLSQDSHLQGPGLIRQGGFAAPDQDEQLKKKYRSDCVAAAFTLYLAFLSELAAAVARGGDPISDAIGLWSAVGSHMEFANEVWEIRYSKLLPMLTT